MHEFMSRTEDSQWSNVTDLPATLQINVSSMSTSLSTYVCMYACLYICIYMHVVYGCSYTKRGLSWHSVFLEVLIQPDSIC